GEHHDRVAVGRREVDVLAVGAHGNGRAADDETATAEGDAVGAGATGAVLAHAAGWAGELGQGPGPLVPGEGRDGVADSRRDLHVLAVGTHGEGGRAIERHAVAAGPARAVLAHAAGGVGELPEGPGPLVPGEGRDGAAV